jgi:hypothetical protein
VSRNEDSPGVVTQAVGTKTPARHFVHLKGYGDIDLDAIIAGSREPRAEMLLQGFALGYESRQHEVDALQWTADRLYTEMCRRPAPRIPDRPSFESLQATRDAIYAGVNS